MDTGCVFDGHHGQYIYSMIVELAINEGWPEESYDKTWWDGLTDKGASEEMIEAAEEAEEWLNENIAEDGHHYGWNDGEYFYWTDEHWAVV